MQPTFACICHAAAQCQRETRGRAEAGGYPGSGTVCTSWLARGGYTPYCIRQGTISLIMSPIMAHDTRQRGGRMLTITAGWHHVFDHGPCAYGAMFVLHTHGSSGCLSVLCRLQNRPLIKHVVLLLAHGLCADLWESKKSLLPHLAALGAPAVVAALRPTARTRE